VTRLLAVALLLATPLTARANPLAMPDGLTSPVTSPTVWNSTRPMGGALWFYATFISSIDGHRSAGYPVTSLYARQALRAHGPVWGTLLSVDRLLRDWHEIAHPALTLRTDDGRLRYVDPLARNDRWLRERRP
jgi:putative component of membrane protein insertase Oxa1/YidC/SpoIIIJ protein YidD